MTNYIQQAIQQGLIAFDSPDRKTITYLHQNKTRNYQNPEEQIQAQTYCQLVIQYGYPPQHIKLYVPITDGSSTKEADIIVYHNPQCTKPYIVVECKKQDISEAEFKQALKQALSYANLLAGTTKYIWVTKGNKDEYYRFNKELSIPEQIADILHYGQQDDLPFKYVKKNTFTNQQNQQITLNDIEVVSENELIRIFKQAHDALWAGGELNPSQAFDELDKLIFCKIWDEKKTDKYQPYSFQIYTNQTPQELKNRINQLYAQGQQEDAEVFSKPIDLSPERIKTVVTYLQKIDLTNTDLDSKGKAFETFLGTYFRGEFGQFFTPRAVVKLMIEVLPINHQSKVLDTSCGSGGFLLYALDKVRQQANQKYDPTDPKEAILHHKHWHDFAEKRLYGIEINEQIARTAKMNMIIHDDGHTNVVAFDGLHNIAYISQQTNNLGFQPNSFNFIVTNPPFGSIIKQSEKAYLQIDTATNRAQYHFALKEINWIDQEAKQKHLATKDKQRENQSTEILFIEQCYNFLQPNGYLAIVLPDGILTNSSLQYVRDWIELHFRIVAIVSLPQTAFTHTGAGVKSSVLFLKKYPPDTTTHLTQKQTDLQKQIAINLQIAQKYQQWDQQKRQQLKAIHPKDDTTKTQRDAINEQFTEQWNNLQTQALDAYQQAKQTQAQVTPHLHNYPIFMAIANNIGYDATGKDSTTLIAEQITPDGKQKTEHRQDDLSDKLITKPLNNQQYTTQTEQIIPNTGIIGALKQFIESIENNTDANFQCPLQ